PLSPTEIDTVADLVSARSRVADLRKIYRDALREYRENTDSDSARRHVLAVARQIDTATAAAQRQARRLGLGSTTLEKQPSGD
ncbi:hypothetical protein, partial [Mesorhizobium sp. M0058]|uniref:hypothetical protein n=1 Tax=Mesorhizobium sp. M0058 TaxID=2956865 RepID=UPI00333CF50D